jgi:hypothetical protein
VLISLPFGAVGSGLILLVIVAAWLAVLVPMALRSHDSADSLSSVDRFSDAMRVLSRRDAAARARARAVAGPARLGSDVDDDDLDDDEWDDDDLLDEWDDDVESTFSRVRRSVGSAAGTAGALVRRRPRRAGPVTAAARRRRLLFTLLALSAVTLLAGLLVSSALLVAHGVVDVLLVLFVVQLRRLTLQRAAARASSTRRRVPEPRRERPSAPRTGSVRVQPTIVQEQPADDQTLVEPQPGPEEVYEEPVAVAVARHDEPLPAAAGLGAPWSPVPVPPPIYASAPVAPRGARTVDLTRPGAYTESVTAGERLPGMEDPAPEGVVEPRRAVNDW